MVVQLSPSSQGISVLTWTQPLRESHESMVHVLKSSQEIALPGPQLPTPPQIPVPVHASPSSHGPSALLSKPQIP